jgi:hypothetical protein
MMFSMVLIDGKPYARGLRERHSIMWLDPDAKDRFGLPHRPPETEDKAARRERLNHVRNLIVDATQSVARQVGDREARHLFKLAFRKPPKGRRRTTRRTPNFWPLMMRRSRAAFPESARRASRRKI